MKNIDWKYHWKCLLILSSFILTTLNVWRTSYMIYMFFKSSPDRKCICTFTAKRDFMLKTIFCSAIFLSFKFVFSFKIILLCKLFFSLQYLFSCPLYFTRFNLLNVWWCVCVFAWLTRSSVSNMTTSMTSSMRQNLMKLNTLSLANLDTR